MYNIEVEGDHCYRVGQQGLLVHNTSPAATPATPATPAWTCHPCDNLIEKDVPVTLAGKGDNYEAVIDRWFSATRRGGKVAYEYCRVKSIKGKIARFKADSDSSESRTARNWMTEHILNLLPNQKNDYQAGHLIADKLGGPNNYRQMVAMSRTFNKTSQLWTGMENWIFGCLAGVKRRGVKRPNPTPGIRWKVT